MPAITNSRISPLVFPIRAGLQPPRKITIAGRPLPNPQKFTISLQNGSSPLPSPIPSPDVALHMSVGFSDSSIVRKSRRDNVWGAEETSVPGFPFQEAFGFTIVIVVEESGFIITINNICSMLFEHRLTDLTLINTLCIVGDIVVSSIKVSST